MAFVHGFRGLLLYFYTKSSSSASCIFLSQPSSATTVIYKKKKKKKEKKKTINETRDAFFVSSSSSSRPVKSQQVECCFILCRAVPLNVLDIITEQIGNPVEYVKDGEEKRKRNSRDDIYALRSSRES